MTSIKLTDKALLVQLNISQWTARKFDKRVTDTVAANNGVAADVGRYNKSLLPMSEQLVRVKKKATAIRTKYYENTLPWGMDGTQMLPSANYLAFVSEFRKEKAEWERLVNDFVADYPQLKFDAQTYLGPLYNESDYPAVDEIRSRFRMDLAVFPVPSNDFRVNIADAELERIQQDVEVRVRQAASEAMRDVWQRLYDRVKHLADKLSDPKAVFRDSTVENIRELCALLPRLNFADDPNLEAMRQEVEAKLVAANPDDLRHDAKLRASTASEANQIIAQMGAFMGDNA